MEMRLKKVKYQLQCIDKKGALSIRFNKLRNLAITDSIRVIQIKTLRFSNANTWIRHQFNHALAKSHQSINQSINLLMSPNAKVEEINQRNVLLQRKRRRIWTFLHLQKQET